MKNLVITRIDERMLHGQILTNWLPSCKANIIVICDDEIATNNFRKRILMGLKPANCELHVLSVKDSYEYLSSDGGENDRVMVLTKGPQAYLELHEMGLPLSVINIGMTPKNPKRSLLYRAMYVSEEEKEVMRKLIDCGITLEYKQLVEDTPVNLKTLL